MSVQLFLLKDFISDDEKFHLARVKIRSRQDLSLHKHDFAEIFWVENGSGIHLINQKKVKLNSGDLVMIRPSDEHNFTSKKGLTIMNLAFRRDTLDFLYNRYFNKSDSYFWTEMGLPFVVSLDPNVIKMISQKAKQAASGRDSYLNLDNLLLFIFKMIRTDEAFKASQDMPVWLLKGMNAFNSSEYLKSGVSGFAAMCEKNIDHVNRVVRKNLGKTLTSLVTELRMNFASRQLTYTNTPIKNICNDCGFENLGHFYKVFKQTHQQTPGQYRRTNQKIC